MGGEPIISDNTQFEDEEFLQFKGIMYPKAKLFCSSCITFENCRWDGAVIASPEVNRIKKIANFITACPEMEIGLETPRESLQLLDFRGKPRLIQPTTGQDLTAAMDLFANTQIPTWPALDGIILKSNSATCGSSGVAVYSPAESRVMYTVEGVFGGKLQRLYPHTPVINEIRLRDPLAYDQFLTKVFLSAGLRNVLKSENIVSVQNFHDENKLILMALNPQKMEILGQILQNEANLPVDKVFSLYQKEFNGAIMSPFSIERNIAVFDYVISDYLKIILDENALARYTLALDEYRNGNITRSALINLFKNCIVENNLAILQTQRFFHPYPAGLDSPSKASDDSASICNQA